MGREAIFYNGSQIQIGEVRCGRDDPDIGVLGPIQGWCISFPRLPIQLMRNGRFSFIADGSCILVLTPGAVIDRKALSANGSRCQWVSVSEVLLDDFRSKCRRKREVPFGLDFVCTLTKTPDLSLLERRLFRRAVEASAGDADLSELACSVLDSTLMTRPGAPLTRGDQELADAARAFLVIKPTRVVRSDMLAAQLGVSVFHLCRTFKRATGLTLQEFSRRLRLDLALERLVVQDVDLSALALDLGFSSHSHFSAAFRNVFGISPSDYRERRRRRQRRAIA